MREARLQRNGANTGRPFVEDTPEVHTNEARNLISRGNLITRAGAIALARAANRIIIERKVRDALARA